MNAVDPDLLLHNLS